METRLELGFTVAALKDDPYELLALALDAGPAGMLMVDDRGRIVLVNVQLEKLFGYSRQELLGRPVETLVPERFRVRHPELRAAFQAEPQLRAMGAGRHLYGLRKDGSEVPIEIGLNPLRTPLGSFVLSSVVDITERKRAEREREELLEQLQQLNAALEERVRQRTAALTATLGEREVLLQEIHHRVKNNLYVIVSLMEMQARSLGDGEGRVALEECRGRVHAIALIHEKLYQAKNYADVPFADYLRGLANDILHATGVSPAVVDLRLAVADVAITVEKAIPCALILNELITNALKHAFPGGRRGTITVNLEAVGVGRLRLVVADDGVGLPVGLNVPSAKSLGLRLVATLAQQLDADLALGNDAGTSIALTFPV